MVSKVYDTTNHVEKGEITFYVQGIKAHEEILLSWSENYLIQKDCTDADCLRYLFYEVFQIEEDEYLNETIDLFNQYQEVVDLFITQRQKLSNYDGFIQITIRDEKEVQKYHASTISIGQGKKDDLVIQSQVYILNLK